MATREPDALTLERARRGQASAVAAILHHYSDTVYAVVGRLLVGHRESVDDLAQDVFVKMINGLRNVRGERPGALTTWVVTVATRSSLDYLRRPRLVEPAGGAELDELQHGGGTPEQAASRHELGRRVEAAMAALPAEQRAALVLRVFHDLDYSEIAAALRVERGTVKSRIGRARQALRQAVVDWGGADG